MTTANTTTATIVATFPARALDLAKQSTPIRTTTAAGARAHVKGNQRRARMVGDVIFPPRDLMSARIHVADGRAQICALGTDTACMIDADGAGTMGELWIDLNEVDALMRGHRAAPHVAAIAVSPVGPVAWVCVMESANVGDKIAVNQVCHIDARTCAGFDVDAWDNTIGERLFSQVAPAPSDLVPMRFDATRRCLAQIGADPRGLQVLGTEDAWVCVAIGDAGRAVWSGVGATAAKSAKPSKPAPKVAAPSKPSKPKRAPKVSKPKPAPKPSKVAAPVSSKPAPKPKRAPKVAAPKPAPAAKTSKPKGVEFVERPCKCDGARPEKLFTIWAFDGCKVIYEVRTYRKAKSADKWGAEYARWMMPEALKVGVIQGADALQEIAQIIAA